MNTKQKLSAAGLPKGQWVMAWGAVLAIATVAFLWNLFVIVRDTNRDAGYLEIVGNLRVLSQQIGSSAREAVDGNADAFETLAKARTDFDGALKDLANGTDELPSPRELLGEELTLLGKIWSAIDPAASTIVQKRESIQFLNERANSLNAAIPKVQEHSGWETVPNWGKQLVSVEESVEVLEPQDLEKE